MKKVDEITVTDTSELMDAIDSGYYDSVPYFRPSYLKEGTVIDEEKSVKWNREEVARLNAEVKQKKEDNKNERAAMYEKQTNDIITVYSNYSGFTEEQVGVVYSYAYQESHSAGVREVIYTLEEVLDVMMKVNEIKN